MVPRALLAVVFLLVGFAVPDPAVAAPVSKAQLLTLDQVTALYPQVADNDGDATRGIYSYGISAPAYSRSARLECDHYRDFRGTSRVVGFYYSGGQRSISVEEDLVQFRTKREARAVLQHYRDFATTCHGTHATDDGEGGAATMDVRAWHPRDVGRERVGLLNAFSERGGLTTWRRDLVVRVGRTVMVLEVLPRSGYGSGARIVKAAELALAELG